MGRRYREKEERNELQAIIAVGSTSSKDILRFHNLDIVHPSYEEKKKGRGNNITTTNVKVDVRGQDVFARGEKQTTLWDRFLLFRNKLNKDLISLTNDADRLAEEYYAYLIDSYPASDRYRNLDMEGQIWLRKVVRLSVMYHIMENKLAGHLRSLHDETDDRDYFCHEYALFYYTLMSKAKLEKSEVASVMNRILKDEDQKKDLLDEFFNKYTNRLQEITAPLQDKIMRFLPEDDNGKGDY